MLTWGPGGWARAPAVGPWRRERAAVLAPAPVRVPFTSRRWLPAAPAASASDSPLGWRRPRNEPPSALVAGMRNGGEVAGGWGGGGGGRPLLGGMERAGGRRGTEAARSRELGLVEAAGADPVREPLPAETLEMPTTGFVASPPSLGRCAPVPLRLRQSLEQLKLGSRDAQPIREGSGGKLGRGWEPLFLLRPNPLQLVRLGPCPEGPDRGLGGSIAQVG